MSAFSGVWARLQHPTVAPEYAKELFNAGLDAAAAECARQEKCPGLSAAERYRAGYLRERIIAMKGGEET